MTTATMPVRRAMHIDQADVSDTNADQHLETLRTICELKAWLDDQTDEFALSARMRGATWDEIGSALEMTKQGAQQRWATIVTRKGDRRFVPPVVRRVQAGAR